MGYVKNHFLSLMLLFVFGCGGVPETLLSSEESSPVVYTNITEQSSQLELQTEKGSNLLLVYNSKQIQISNFTGSYVLQNLSPITNYTGTITSLTTNKVYNIAFTTKASTPSFAVKCKIGLNGNLQMSVSSPITIANPTLVYSLNGVPLLSSSLQSIEVSSYTANLGSNNCAIKISATGYVAKEEKLVVSFGKLAAPTLSVTNNASASVVTIQSTSGTQYSYELKEFTTNALVKSGSGNFSATSATVSLTGLTTGKKYTVSVVASRENSVPGKSESTFTTTAASLDMSSPDVPLYLPFVSGITVTPDYGRNRSVIKSSTPMFSSWWVGKIELALLRAHRNPTTFPTGNVVNGNYWPGLTTSRYSKVVAFIDEKTIEVDFAYNSASVAKGYFFKDMRSWFNTKLTASGDLELLNGEVYVSKGGWNFTVDKNVRVWSSGKAGIKLSFEDAFPYQPSGYASATGNDNNYNSTFGSNNFFIFSDNTSFDCVVENVNLIPPTYNVKSNQYGRVVTNPFFYHKSTLDFNDLSVYITGLRMVKNSDMSVEDGYWPSDATLLGPFFATSPNGGKVSGTDNSLLQEFRLENVNWRSREIHGVTDLKRVGNLITFKNSTIKADSRIDQGIFKSQPIKLENSTNYTKVNYLSPDFSVYQVIYDTWALSFGHHLENVYNDRRSHYLKVTNGANSYKLYLSNYGAFGDDSDLVSGGMPRIWGANHVYMKEKIPVVGQELAVDDIKVKRVTATEYMIDDLGLQALTTVPFVADAYAVPTVPNANDSYTSSDSDTLAAWDGTTWITIKVMKRARYARATVLTGLKKPYWVFTFDKSLPTTVTKFKVTKSLTEFALNPSGITADVIYYVFGNMSASSADPNVSPYFDYTVNTTNLNWENSTLSGFSRGSGEEKVIQSSQTIDKLYNVTKIKRFVNVKLQGGMVLPIGSGIARRKALTGSGEVIIQND